MTTAPEPKSELVLQRAHQNRFVLAAFVIVALALGTIAVLSSHAAVTPIAFAASGLNGSGFQNVVAYSPFKDGSVRPVLIGADIAGIHRSTDDGKNWYPSNVGLGNHHVAAIMFSKTVAGKVYAATDSKLFVSTDFGKTWTGRGGSVNFDANGVFRPNGKEHPRPTGNLIAQDTSSSPNLLYIATATQGVKRSSDDGASWEQVALTGQHLRSLALDPADGNSLYVGDITGGMQVSTNAKGAFTFAPAAAGGPAIAEELSFVNGTLYVAGGSDGIFSYNGSWHGLNNDIPTSSIWESVTGYRDTAAGRTVLYVGCSEPVGGKHTMKSTDGGASWTSISAGPNVSVSTKEYGQSMNWWAAGSTFLSFSGNAFVTADIAVNPDDRNMVIIAGRGGAKVGEQSSTGVAWWPAVHGLMVTVNNQVVADPKLPGRIYDASMDYTFISSKNNAENFVSGTSPGGAPSTGDAIALDPDGAPGVASKVFLAASDRGQATGSGFVYSNPDPLDPASSWKNESLPVSSDVVAIGVGHDGNGAQVILASVTNQGLYRKVGSSWEHVTGTAPFANGGYGGFAWRPGTATVYAVDANGIWRNLAAGKAGEWTRLFAGSAGYDNNNPIVVDPMHAGIFYVSSKAAGGVVKISGADAANPVESVILALNNPGPIAITPTGILYAHDAGGDRLMRSGNPSSPGTGFSDVANGFYQDNNGNIRSLAAGPDGYLYTASNSAGLSVGHDGVPASSPSGLPVSSPTPPPTPTPSPVLTTTPNPLDSIPPVIRFAVGTSSTLSGSTTLGVTASDNVGVTAVALTVDGTQVIRDTAAPFTAITWNSALVPNGSHVLQLVAEDAAGNKGVSGLFSVTVSNTASLRGDLNSDGRVNILDLSNLLSKWGSSDISADLNKDGRVDILDLSVELNAWTG